MEKYTSRFCSKIIRIVRKRKRLRLKNREGTNLTVTVEYERTEARSEKLANEPTLAQFCVRGSREGVETYTRIYYIYIYTYIHNRVHINIIERTQISIYKFKHKARRSGGNRGGGSDARSLADVCVRVARSLVVVYSLC